MTNPNVTDDPLAPLRGREPFRRAGNVVKALDGKTVVVPVMPGDARANAEAVAVALNVALSTDARARRAGGAS